MALFPIYREVKVGGLCTFPMWDFVPIVVVVTRVMEIRFSNWELQQSDASARVWHFGRVSSFGRGGGMSALVF
ncbi:hypothetical protein ACE6H2_005871 [Prunus campanulata]